jgi:hypothetical protein
VKGWLKEASGLEDGAYDGEPALERSSQDPDVRAICFACICTVAITAHKICRPELANSIAAFTY